MVAILNFCDITGSKRIPDKIRLEDTLFVVWARGPNLLQSRCSILTCCSLKVADHRYEYIACTGTYRWTGSLPSMIPVISTTTTLNAETKGHSCKLGEMIPANSNELFLLTMPSMNEVRHIDRDPCDVWTCALAYLCKCLEVTSTGDQFGIYLQSAVHEYIVHLILISSGLCVVFTWGGQMIF